MFSDSWNAPWFTAASPKKQTTTRSSSRYLMVQPTPVASGIWPPTMPQPPRKFFSRLYMCIEPPLPFEQPSTRP